MPLKNLSIWWVSVFLDSLQLPMVFHRLQKDQDQDSNVYCMYTTVQKNHKCSNHQWYFWQISCLVSGENGMQRTVLFFKTVVVVFFSVHQQTLALTFRKLHRQVPQARCPRFKASFAQQYCYQNLLSVCKQPSFSPCSKPMFLLSLISSDRETELQKIHLRLPKHKR